MRSKAMITSMSSSAPKHLVSGNTVAVQAGFNTDKMDDVNKLLTRRDAGGTEQSQFQSSVRSVTIALGIFAGLATLVKIR